MHILCFKMYSTREQGGLLLPSVRLYNNNVEQAPEGFKAGDIIVDILSHGPLSDGLLDSRH